MANVLTDLIPDAFAAANQVATEDVGFTRAVSRNSSLDRIAQGSKVIIDIPRPGVAKDIASAQNPTTAADVTIDNVTVEMTKFREVEFAFTGEEQGGLQQGPTWGSVRAGIIAEAIRTLRNEMEVDVAKEASLGASRAYGTAGSGLFTKTNGLKDSAESRKIIDLNGAPKDNRSLVISLDTAAAYRTLDINNDASAHGSDALRREGALGYVHGTFLRESAGSYVHTAGTASGWITNGALTKGATKITVDGGGSTTILVGDLVTFQGESEKYVVSKGKTSTGTSFEINKPGLVSAVADNRTMTFSAGYKADVNMSGSSVLLASRLGWMPVEGDASVDRFSFADSVSGIVYEILAYRGQRMNKYAVSTCWGVKTVKPEFLSLLIS